MVDVRCFVQKQCLSWCILCGSNRKCNHLYSTETFLTGSEYLLCVRYNFQDSLLMFRCWYEEEVPSRLVLAKQTQYFATLWLIIDAMFCTEIALGRNSHTWNDKWILICMSFFIKQMLCVSCKGTYLTIRNFILGNWKWFCIKQFDSTQNLLMDYNLTTHSVKNCASIKILGMVCTWKLPGTKHHHRGHHVTEGQHQWLEVGY